jgi:hypothetical protein
MLVWVAAGMGAALLLGLLVLLDGTLRAETTEFKIETPSLAGGQELRIVQISDLHGRTRFWQGSASEMVNALRPDIVCVTGDLFNRLRELPGVLQDLSRLDCGCIYFVPGNHERQEMLGRKRRALKDAEYREVLSRIESAGLKVMDNRGEWVTINGAVLMVYGFDNSRFGKERYRPPEPAESQTAFRLFMAHAPSIIRWMDRRSIPFDLLLTGHTHGGQIAPLRKFLGYYAKYHVGMKRLPDGRCFYINRGMGTIHLPFRLFCRPEIALFRLTGGQRRPLEETEEPGD